MRVSREDKDGIAVLRLEGDFDSFETEMVRDGFDECFRQGHADVVLDLEQMSFANSTTLACFISGQKGAQARGGQVVLAGPRDFILKTLKTLGLSQVFAIAESVDEAIAKLKGD